MKPRDNKPAAAEDCKETFTLLSRDAISRREFLAVSAAVGVTLLLPGGLSAAVDGKKTFTILHTNDMHSSFIGMGPAADYTPFTLNDDTTRGGYARLAALIAKRKEARKGQGPVLVLDAGDYSMGTAFGAATRETGGELQLMSRMGYDATTFGNHEFDLGPDGLGKSIGVAAKAGRVPAVLASNTNFAKQDATLADLQRLAKDGVIRRYLVIERGGIRFGIFGLLGKEAQFYTGGAGAATFSDAIETAKEMVKVLRETEKVDVVIALSHGGVEKGKDGRFTEGDDVRLAKDVPGIDVVIGGHSHTELQEAIIVNDRTPVVQTGKESQNLGELVVTMDGGKLTVESYKLYPIDDTIAGDRAIADEIDKLKKGVTAAVFASRGYSIDQPLAVAPRDLPNTFTDIAASTLLANLCTDAFRKATKADIGFSANGLMRAGLDPGEVGRADRLRCVRRGAPRRRCRGYHGRQRTRDRLLHRPGAEESARVSARGQPGPPRRVFSPHLRHEVPLRPVAPEVRRRDGHRVGRPRSRLPRDRHHAGRTSACIASPAPCMLGQIIVAIPKYTKGKLALVPKNKEGQPLKSKVEALDDASRQLALPAAAAGHGGHEQCRHGDGERRCP